MSYPGSYPAPSYGSWPVSSDTGGRAVRADVAAFILLLVGGAAGIGQLFVPWYASSADLPGRHAGWQIFQSVKQGIPGLGFSYTFAAYAILAVAVVGVAMVLLGVAMLFPIDHRPLGVVAMVAAAIGLICAVWWAFWAPPAGIHSIGERFADAGIGWYLFLTSGLVGLIGAIKSLVTR